jgi:hypothetical protein
MEKIGVHLDIIFYVPSPSSASIFCGLYKKDNFQCNKIVVCVTFFLFLHMPQEMSFCKKKTLMDEHKMFKTKPRIFHLKLLTF